ncbi:MAG: AAA family ATPase [Rhodospirillales bacterium]|nr:AAA family ATPase [Rhodospirillales bacterium]
MSRVVVFGNSKGGTGKSTLALHAAVAAMVRGLRVATLDLDPDQGTLTRYVENRGRLHPNLPQTTHRRPAMGTEEAVLASLLAELAADHDLLVIDTPGADTPMARLGHAAADILVTPLNDSLVDFDLLARVDPESLRIERPGIYAERVWEAKKRRALQSGGSLDWVVLRNRLSPLESRNSRAMDGLLKELERRIRCRILPGLAERVIYRELFLKGLTLLDIRAEGSGVAMNLSHVAARQELRTLFEGIGL